MRCSVTPSLVLATPWLMQRSTAFLVAPACRCTLRRAPQQHTQQRRRHQRNVATSSLSNFRGVLRNGRAITSMAIVEDEDGGKWVQAGAMMGAEEGATPEDMMRRMSIPELAQKLDQAESMYGQVHPQVAGALIPLAQALYANGDLGPARDACTRALKILQSAFGQTPRIETAECLHTMAMIQQVESPEIGDKALGSQNMALELAMRVCGPDSIEAAAYSRCLAQMSEHYSQFLSPDLPRPFYMPSPVPLYRRTLAILEKVVGKDNPEVASALDDLASALLFWRDADSTDFTVSTLLPEAEELAARSLTISRASVGAVHPMTAGREHNLGMIKRAQGREDEALENFRRALKIREKALGVDHPDTKSSRSVVEDKNGASTGA